jgi:hypothetical protein
MCAYFDETKGIVHVDRDYERIAEVRPLLSRRLRI